MSLAGDILALRDLVKEGHLPWYEAAVQLRQDHKLTHRELYTTGAALLFQLSDPEYQRRLHLALVGKRVTT